MAINFDKGYTKKSNAIRAMKAAGLESGVYNLADAWFVARPLAKPEAAKLKRGGKRTKFSTVAKPCSVVREFVKKHPKLDRAATLAKLVAMGVDKTTASIQYHKAKRA